MTKQQLHNMRQKINDLFYHLFESLDLDQKKSLQMILIEIDDQIKTMEDF